MIANRGYDAYAKNKILTASPAELTLMLYEGAIKFCNIAITAIEEKNIENVINIFYFSTIASTSKATSLGSLATSTQDLAGYGLTKYFS